MLRKRLFLLVGATAFAVASAGLVACGGDDTGVPPPADGGTDVTVHPDAPPPPTDGGGMDTNPPPPVDGGDAGPCDFNTFVIGLINNHTNNTDLPSTDLGQGCVDTQTPFPASVFQ